MECGHAETPFQYNLFSILSYVAQTCTNKCKREHDSDKMGEFIIKHVRLLKNMPAIPVEDYGLHHCSRHIHNLKFAVVFQLLVCY